MARATSERLVYVVPFQLNPLSTTVTQWSTPLCSRTSTEPGLMPRFSGTGGTQGLRAITRRALVSDPVEEADRLSIEIAKRVCLDAIGNDAQEQVARQVRRSRRAKELAPADPQVVNIELVEASEFRTHLVGVD